MSSVWGKVWDMPYLSTRLQTKLNYKAGAILATNCFYSGYAGNAANLDIVVNGLTYAVVPDSVMNNYLWMRNNNIFNQRGTLSGVISVSGTYIYIQTNDGTYQSP
jgi:hypothetical protein